MNAFLKNDKFGPGYRNSLAMNIDINVATYFNVGIY